MEWLPKFELGQGDERKIETPWCEVSVRLRDGLVDYSRPPLVVDDGTERIVSPDADENEGVNKQLILESLGKKCEFDFLPIYPDRPYVFKIEDDLAIPPGGNGFFCLTLEIGMGVGIPREEFVFEEIRPAPKKNSYWGPPNDGVLTYQGKSGAHSDPVELMETTGFETAVVPVYYKNRRSEGNQVNRCLIPLRELHLYESDSGDLIFEVVELEHKEEHYQEPRPIKRAPREVKSDVTRLLQAPDAPQSLFETVRSLPRLDRLTSVFANR